MLLFSFVLFSCNEVRRINDNGVCTIDLDNVQKKESVSFSSLFEAAGVIVLEMTDNSLLAKIDKIEFIGDSLYVLERGKGLYLFDEKGKFLRKNWR